MQTTSRNTRATLVAGILTFSALFGQSIDAAETVAPLHIEKVAGEIVIDGRLDEPAWSDAVRVERWYETNPGDSIEPDVANIGYLAYDDRFFYAAFVFDDPEPERIVAPLSDHDNVPSSTDYAGVIIDANNDGKTAQMFLANPRGIQYDAINSDVSGEDSSPDFYWTSAARIGENGWTLELAIPFSSLRYEGEGPHTWRILLYRNRPRDFRYQMFSAPLPRDRSCFICNATPIEGLDGLPTGGSLVIAPYATANASESAQGGVGSGAGSGLESDSTESDLGLDVKWTPNPETAIDLTINPDFSQIESDVAQISSNERFALFFPEKRPFFLEGVDLLDTPVNIVHTRTITSPSWGLRATGAFGNTRYTALVADDRGGGSVIIPGSNGSSLVDQPASMAAITRVRHDLGESFISFLAAGREVDGGGSNLVVGPDFRWRLRDTDTISGQFVASFTETPNLPNITEEWDGRKLDSHAAEFWYYHQDQRFDLFALYTDVGDDFRADLGFVPQVGIRQAYGEFGYTRRRESKVPRIRFFLSADRTEDRDGVLVDRDIKPGFGFDTLWSSFVRFEAHFEEVRAGAQVLPRDRVIASWNFTPSRIFERIELRGETGDQIDFANSRPGTGGSLRLNATVRLSDRIEVRMLGDRRWIDVDPEDRAGGRLFTATLARLRATYTFNARSYLRLIGQQVHVDRDPSLYLDKVDPKAGDLTVSAQFAYRLNWQTVLYLGYGEESELSLDERYEPTGRQLFFKMSYAWQR